jgi:plasmid stabilization system protein ParE
MRILFKDSFLERLENQIDYISSDSPKRARKFKNDLLSRIKEISDNPYKFRKSIYFDNSNIRDLIFKGYTVVFRINENQIEVFGFVKYQKNPTD